MIVVGLTGSIAMGKSTVAQRFHELGAPVFDADIAVKGFYSGDGVKAIEVEFPGVTVSGKIDRDRLAARVLDNPEALKRLESLVHPAVAEERKKFIERGQAEGWRLAVVDVPLLFETGAESSVDLAVVVSAPEDVQRARALRRQGMTQSKLAAILRRQTPDVEKRRRAHFVIDTMGSRERTRAEVAQFMRAVAGLTKQRSSHA